MTAPLLAQLVHLAVDSADDLNEIGDAVIRRAIVIAEIYDNPQQYGREHETG